MKQIKCSLLAIGIIFITNVSLQGAIEVKPIVTSGIGVVAGVGVACVLEYNEAKKQRFTPEYQRALISGVLCTVPPMIAFWLLHNNRYGSLVQYGASIATALAVGTIKNRCIGGGWNNNVSFHKGKNKKLLIYGALSGLIYGGSALIAKTLADLGAQRFFPSVT